MSVNQLAGRYEAVFNEPCRSRNKQYLLRRIAWRLQANDEGGLSRAALERAARLAAGADVRLTAPRAEAATPAPKSNPRPFKDWDPQLPPPKSPLEREYKGRVIRVVVLQDGFLYENQHFSSLSAVAKAVNRQQRSAKNAMHLSPADTPIVPSVAIHSRRRSVSPMTPEPARPVCYLAKSQTPSMR